MQNRWFAVLVIAAGCGGGSGSHDAGGAGRDDGGGGLDAQVLDSGPTIDAKSCQPPDMLIVLDRTMSMHRKPNGDPPANTAAGHAKSKWYLAITAVESFTAGLDKTVRFGLELFPRDPGGDACVTLTQRISGTTAKNTACEAGEVVVQPGLETGVAIAGAIDPETTRLCTSTPIGAGLETARTALAAIADPVRKQFALLITDGQDTCDGTSSPPLSIVDAQALAADGVNLYVIGFDATGTGVDNGHLNDMACAGRTAKGFPTPCTDDGAGNFTATNRGGPELYILAEDQAQLTTELEAVAGEVCCNCIN